MTSPVSSRPSPVANPARALVASWTVLYLLAGCPGGDAGTTATEPASTTESDAEASTGGAPTTASPDPSTGPTTGSMPDATSGLTTGGTTGGTGEPLPDETTGGVIPVPPACDDPKVLPVFIPLWEDNGTKVDPTGNLRLLEELAPVLC